MMMTVLIISLLCFSGRKQPTVDELGREGSSVTHTLLARVQVCGSVRVFTQALKGELGTQMGEHKAEATRLDSGYGTGLTLCPFMDLRKALLLP